MKDYKLEQRAFRELAVPRYYPKGVVVPDTVDKDGKVHSFPNDLGAPKNRYKARNFTKPGATHKVNPSKRVKPLIGSNHERMLIRKSARVAGAQRPAPTQS